MRSATRETCQGPFPRRLSEMIPAAPPRNGGFTFSGNLRSDMQGDCFAPIVRNQDHRTTLGQLCFRQQARHWRAPVNSMFLNANARSKAPEISLTAPRATLSPFVEIINLN